MTYLHILFDRDFDIDLFVYSLIFLKKMVKLGILYPLDNLVLNTNFEKEDA